MTKETTVEELLKPRYKAIGDYPGCRFNEGEILIPDRLDGTVNNVWVNTAPSDKRFINVQVENFPHLFRPLAWYEEREASEMPQYVKYIGEIHGILKVSKWHIDEDDVWFDIENGNKNGYSAMFATPATEAEYQEYINSKTNQ